jgi:hypothetical protein
LILTKSHVSLCAQANLDTSCCAERSARRPFWNPWPQQYAHKRRGQMRHESLEPYLIRKYSCLTRQAQEAAQRHSNHISWLVLLQLAHRIARKTEIRVYLRGTIVLQLPTHEFINDTLAL